MIYVCMNLFVMMECKKNLKFTVLGHFAECCTRQRTPLPSAMVTALGKAGKMGARKTIFLALPSAMTMAPGKEFFLKKIQTLPSASKGALGKEFLEKKFKLCRVPTRGHSVNNFFF